MSDYAELGYQFGLLSWEEWKQGKTISPESLCAFADVSMIPEFDSMQFWLIWRLTQLGARTGSSVLILTDMKHVDGLNRLARLFGLERVDIDTASDRFRDAPRWTYDFILDFDRKESFSTSDPGLYARIGAGGVLYVGSDQPGNTGQRWHSLAGNTEGFCLRQRHTAPFVEGFVEEFWSLDN